MIKVYVVKIAHHDRFGGQTSRPKTFPGTDYYFEGEWGEVYANRTQSTLVRIETDEGIHGWGESQGPIVPEVAATIIERLLGPMLIGEDPLDSSRLWQLMYRSMNVRGHWTGFMGDAIAGLDIALWDIRGKAMGRPIATLLGGTFRSRLPAYVSGVRAPSPEARAEMAAEHLREGYAAVKLYLGRGVEADITEAIAARKAVGPTGRLLSDLLWRYSLPDAVRLGRELQALNVEWIEAPLDPEDLVGHAELCRELDVAIAVGEPLRSPRQFVDWFEGRALDIAQPDVARCGITVSHRVAELATARGLPIAYHVGICLGIANAATWHAAAAAPTFYIQESLPPLIEVSNEFLDEPLQIDHGKLKLPTRPGLGVDVNERRLAKWVDATAEVRA